MQDTFIASISEAAMQINTLWFNSVEKSINLQIEACSHYANIGFEQVKKAIEVKDLEDLQTLANEQPNLSESINKKIIDDSKAVSDLTQEFIKNSEKIWQIL